MIIKGLVPRNMLFLRLLEIRCHQTAICFSCALSIGLKLESASIGHFFITFIGIPSDRKNNDKVQEDQPFYYHGLLVSLYQALRGQDNNIDQAMQFSQLKPQNRLDLKTLKTYYLFKKIAQVQAHAKYTKNYVVKYSSYSS